MHRQESEQENVMQKISLDFEIQTHNLIRPNGSQQKKKKKKKKENLSKRELFWAKIKENGMRDKYLDLTRERKKKGYRK